MVKTAIILEDEGVAMRRLQRMIGELFGNQIEIIATCDSVADLIEQLSDNQPDILFLDIMVSDGNSLELFDVIEVRSNVIFTTAFNEYAIQAFRKNAVDYLLKPIRKNELVEAVNKINPLSSITVRKINREIEPFKKRFLIRFGNKLHSVRTDEIAYVYSEDKLSFFIQKDGKKIPSDLRLQNIQEMLDPNLFFRVNRQFIVHIDSIEKMLRYSRSRINLKLDPPYAFDIVISTENTPKFKEWMDR